MKSAPGRTWRFLNMPALEKAVAALRVFGDDVDPKELTRLLGCSCTHGWVKGHKYTTSSGAVVIKNTGGWILEAEPAENADFDGQISRLLGSINASEDGWAAIKTRFKVDILCGWFMLETSEEITVSPQTMRLLSERNILLSVCLYAPLD